MGINFSHEKVLEASYNLLDENERKQFHYEIGMALFRASGNQSSCGFEIIADQCNRGSINQLSVDNVDIVEVNLMASVSAFSKSNYLAAYTYSSLAMKYLPSIHWQTQYDLSKRVYLVHAQSAYANGVIKESTDIMNQVLQHVTSLDDKISALNLKVTLLRASQKAQEAYDVCVAVLTELGENIPTPLDARGLDEKTMITKSNLSALTIDDVGRMKTVNHGTTARV